jgi:hypothetical protein
LARESAELKSKVIEWEQKAKIDDREIKDLKFKYD